jgi:hypothetical protein
MGHAHSKEPGHQNSSTWFLPASTHLHLMEPKKIRSRDEHDTTDQDEIYAKFSIQ